MSKLTWYWHRLCAMTPREMALHTRKKARQFADARRSRDWGRWNLEATGGFPVLPPPESAPAVLRKALARDAEAILAGRWKAFGHLELKVDDPPRWHCDYLVGRDLATTESAFTLNHRALPDGADIKLIWELSRWHPLVRLAMAAYVLGDGRAAAKCVAWLEDWAKCNPPFRGWNWTSALEVGLRLIQFAWIDGLLAGRAGAWSLEKRLEALRHSLLPPHAWYAWRYRSFGSSANNHLLGELAGLITATARWPRLQKWGAPLQTLQPLWEREVLAQFAEDGGNREQALNYHLFSWELCWQSRLALMTSGCVIADAAEDRLRTAAAFFLEVQPHADLWDYGDSDSAFVTPFWTNSGACVQEWHEWMGWSPQAKSLEYWLGPPLAVRPPRRAPAHTLSINGWWLYPNSGIGLCQSGFWWLRWDVSPLGYLRTAAHGHLDALHLSIWYKGVAMVIDPGTGAYYADAQLRNWLASRAAHNGPCPLDEDGPRRQGPFLWSARHEQPLVTDCVESTEARLDLGRSKIRRRVKAAQDGCSWQVEDFCEPRDALPPVPTPFTVRWQFAPGSWVKRVSDREFVVHRGDVAMEVEVSNGWSTVELIEPGAGEDTPGGKAALDGMVSPAFRSVCRAPCLKLIVQPGFVEDAAETLRRALTAGTFRTTFRVAPKAQVDPCGK